MHLWNSLSFTLYLLLAWLRFLLGVIVLSLAARYFTGLGSFLTKRNDAYNALSIDVKAQVKIFLNTLFINGMAGGTFAYVGGAYSMFVTWRRNQYWLALDVAVISGVVLVLLATFVSNYWLMLTHDFFCSFSYFYPTASEKTAEFARSMCQSMSFRFKMNYQYWLTFLAAMIAFVQLIVGLLILSERKAFVPREWVVARQLILDSIRRQREVKRARTASRSQREVGSISQHRSIDS